MVVHGRHLLMIQESFRPSMLSWLAESPRSVAYLSVRVFAAPPRHGIRDAGVVTCRHRYCRYQPTLPQNVLSEAMRWHCRHPCALSTVAVGHCICVSISLSMRSAILSAWWLKRMARRLVETALPRAQL